MRVLLLSHDDIALVVRLVLVLLAAAVVHVDIGKRALPCLFERMLAALQVRTVFSVSLEASPEK